MKSVLGLVLRRLIVIIHDIVMIPIAWLLAYFFRFNLSFIPHHTLQKIWLILPAVIIIQAAIFFIFGLYRGLWRFASMQDMARIIKSVMFGSVVLVVVFFMSGDIVFIPRSILPLYCLILILLLSGDRFLFRYIKQTFYLKGHGKRVLIIGAGAAGESLVREMLRSPNIWMPICFIDDDLKKRRHEIHGIKILYKCDNISKIVSKYAIDLILIAIPSATAVEMQRIVKFCQDSAVPFQTLPGLAAISNGHVSINDLRDVLIEDLLGRDPVEFDCSKYENAFKDSVVLITGGGGSIGSELCRQVAALKPKKLIVIDHSEYNLYLIDHELSHGYPHLDFIVRLLDITQKEKIEKLFSEFRPNIVFHAAAYKHVPLLESQPEIAIHNNVLGTAIVAYCSVKYCVERFLLISTDKAVNPTNIMGATKRIAELICQYFHNKNSATKFIVVRFGNVLGSVGSVIPLFKKQLQKGGPLTVTHPDISRYFMIIPEATSLIIQSCFIGENGDMFVLDMGEPVKIVNLAEQLIRLSGKEPYKDISIVFTGLRPGEKLFEELYYNTELAEKTVISKIYKIQDAGNCDLDFFDKISVLEPILSKDWLDCIRSNILADLLS